MDGFGLLKALRARGEMPPSIVLTAFGSVENAVRIVHELGAYWYLEKPVVPSTLQALLRRAGAHSRILNEKKVLERQLGYRGSMGELVGKTARMREIFALLQQAAPTKACVLISGERGTGKELAARTIHELSSREGPFLAINCAALPEALIESELFGHEKGSFPGAIERRAGCFELARHGTLLLDEICAVPMVTQAKLLRVLEDSEVRRLGGRSGVEVDVRIIATTHEVLDEAVRHGRLREDLYYRLSVFEVQMPPLRDRREDIPEIAKNLISDMNREHHCKVTDLSPEAIEALMRHDWTGNVWELCNVIERSVIIAGEGTIEMRHLPINLQARPLMHGEAAFALPFTYAAPLSEPRGMAEDGAFVRVKIGTTVEEAEKDLIVRTLEHVQGNKNRAAAMLGITLKTLHVKLNNYGAA